MGELTKDRSVVEGMIEKALINNHPAVKMAIYCQDSARFLK